MQILHCLLHDLGSIFVRLRSLRNADGVVGLIELQRRLFVARNRIRIRLRPLRLSISAARQQQIVGVDLLKDACGLIRQNHVLQHDNVARLRHGEVWLRRNDHAEGLQRRRDIDVVLRARRQHLAKIVRPSVRGDRPQDIG